MRIDLYFTDKAVTFSNEKPLGKGKVINYSSFEEIAKAKIIDFLETTNSIEIICESPEHLFTKFIAQFHISVAAGGAVMTPKGEMLMIYRNGRWDLPKGHLEKGETIEECALREIKEETGVGEIVIREPLHQSYHCYLLNGEWIVKHTHWYLIDAESASATTAQREEGIELVEWIKHDEIESHLTNSYPTIRETYGKLANLA